MTTIFEAPAAAKPAHQRISAEAFWDRFTNAEGVDYEVAAWGDPAATAAKQKDAAKLRIFRRTVTDNGFVVLGKAKVQSFLTSLESPMNGVTILAAGRAAAIYSAAITDDEAF
jgi:hypothetical protein